IHAQLLATTPISKAGHVKIFMVALTYMLSHLLGIFTGYSLFDHRLFRAGAASLLAASIVFLLMPRFIRWLIAHDATSDFDQNRARRSPPIFGGVLVVFAVLISTLCFSMMNAYSI